MQRVKSKPPPFDIINETNQQYRSYILELEKVAKYYHVQNQLFNNQPRYTPVDQDRKTKSNSETKYIHFDDNERNLNSVSPTRFSQEQDIKCDQQVQNESPYDDTRLNSNKSSNKGNSNINHNNNLNNTNASNIGQNNNNHKQNIDNSQDRNHISKVDNSNTTKDNHNIINHKDEDTNNSPSTYQFNGSGNKLKKTRSLNVQNSTANMNDDNVGKDSKSNHNSNRNVDRSDSPNHHSDHPPFTRPPLAHPSNQPDNRIIGKENDIQPDKQTNKQSDRQPDKQINRQTDPERKASPPVTNKSPQNRSPQNRQLISNEQTKNNTVQEIQTELVVDNNDVIYDSATSSSKTPIISQRDRKSQSSLCSPANKDRKNSLNRTSPRKVTPKNPINQIVPKIQDRPESNELTNRTDSSLDDLDQNIVPIGEKRKQMEKWKRKHELSKDNIHLTDYSQLQLFYHNSSLYGPFSTYDTLDLLNTISIDEHITTNNDNDL